VQWTFWVSGICGLVAGVVVLALMRPKRAARELAAEDLEAAPAR
jgi:hypothetical protein